MYFAFLIIYIKKKQSISSQFCIHNNEVSKSEGAQLFFFL